MTDDARPKPTGYGHPGAERLSRYEAILGVGRALAEATAAFDAAQAAADAAYERLDGHQGPIGDLQDRIAEYRAASDGVMAALSSRQAMEAALLAAVRSALADEDAAGDAARA